MKIECSEFQPITITLESREEARELRDGLANTGGDLAYRIYSFLSDKLLGE